VIEWQAPKVQLRVPSGRRVADRGRGYTTFSFTAEEVL
jgi:hypothetical protein